MQIIYVYKVDKLNKKAYPTASSTDEFLNLKIYNLKVKPVPLRNTGFMEEIAQ